jgi:hypothetical protein
MLIKKISSKKVKIGKKDYTESVAVSSEGYIFSWSAKKDRLTKKELKPFLERGPEVIIVTKTSNLSKIDQNLQELLKEKGVLLLFDELNEAINSFNLMVKKKKKAILFLDLK